MSKTSIFVKMQFLIFLWYLSIGYTFFQYIVCWYSYDVNDITWVAFMKIIFTNLPLGLKTWLHGFSFYTMIRRLHWTCHVFISMFVYCIYTVLVYSSFHSWNSIYVVYCRCSKQEIVLLMLFNKMKKSWDFIFNRAFSMSFWPFSCIASQIYVFRVLLA